MTVYIDHIPFCCVWTMAEGLLILYATGHLNSRGSCVLVS